MAPKLQPILPSLEGLPAAIAQFYAKRADGAFVLQLDGARPADMPPAPSPGGGKPKSAAETMHAKLVADAMARVQVNAASRTEVEKFFAKAIEVTEVNGELSVAYRHPSGYRWPSSMAGRDFVADVDELVVRAGENGLLKSEWMIPEAPAAKSEEQLAREDAERLPHQPRNVIVPHNCTVAEYERATKEARRRGGEVFFDDKPAEQPTRTARIGKDVVFPTNGSLDEFARCMELAKQQGGEVVMSDGAAQ